MVYEFRLPDIGEGVAEGEVVQWFVKEGDTVQEDAPLVSVLTDKANVEIPSPKAGRILHLHAAVGDKVKVGGLLVSIETGGSPRAAPTGADSVRPEAPSGGKASPVSPQTSAAAPNVPASGTPSGRSLASPYLRRLAAERGIDLSTLHGSGAGGRITEADLAPEGRLRRPVFHRSPPHGSASPETPTASRKEEPPAKVTPKPGDEAAGVLERIPIRGIRRVIFEHMAEATHRAAHFTYVEEVDVTELVRFRDRMAKHVEKDGVRLSYLPFIIKAVITGFKAQPRANATIDEEAEDSSSTRPTTSASPRRPRRGYWCPSYTKRSNAASPSSRAKFRELAEKARARSASAGGNDGGYVYHHELGSPWRDPRHTDPQLSGGGDPRRS